MKISVLASSLYFFASVATAQNLVPNPGFEEYFSCPQSFNKNKGISKIAPHWNSPSYGTPDLYNTCNTYNMGKQNVTGETSPYSGEGFAGIMTWESKKGYREYLQTELIEPLKANHTYIISFRYQLSSYSKYSIDRIGFVLSTSAFFFNQDVALSFPPPTYTAIKDKALDPYTGTWELLQTEYTAKGTERFLTIGNFYTNADTKATHISVRTTMEPMLEFAAYYYIDEVSVIEKKTETPLAQLGERPLRPEELYILHNVQFEFNTYVLVSESHPTLDSLVFILNQQPAWKIEVQGYTDDVGTEAYNLELSKKRAHSVGDYLISKGIAKERITAEGFGKSKPLVNSTDENARSVNRRVEIKFIGK
jgi:OOP family OmpA-OmpF porin